MEKTLLSQITPTVSYTLSILERSNGKFPTLQLHVYLPAVRDGWEAQSIGSVRRPEVSTPWGDRKAIWMYDFDGDKLSLVEKCALDLIKRMENALRERAEKDALRLERYYDMENCLVLGRMLVQLEDIWK